MSENTSSTGAPAGAEAPPSVPARWSAGRKTEAPGDRRDQRIDLEVAVASASVLE